MDSLLKKSLRLIKVSYYGVRWSIALPRIYAKVFKRGFNYWVDGQEMKGREKWKKIKSRITTLK
jgi:hypothetical protein